MLESIFRETIMNIYLSPAAQAHMAKNLGTAKALRLSLRNSGCSGYSYQLAPDEARPEDLRLDFDEFALIVSSEDASKLDGLRIDLRRKGLSSELMFHNPNARATCGCGGSFTL